MHNKDAYLAMSTDCYNCDIQCHFKKTAQLNLVRVRVTGTHGGGSAPTPMMRDIKVMPCDGEALLTFTMCQDTRCTQTLVSEEVVSNQVLTVDKHSRKRVRAVNGQKLYNSEMVTFDIEFQGRSLEVLALVSSSIAGEVLLSWQVLQRLGVIQSPAPIDRHALGHR